MSIRRAIRILPAVIVCLLLLTAAADNAIWLELPQPIRPGKTVRLVLHAPDGQADITVENSDGEQAAVIVRGAAVQNGEIITAWDGSELSPGRYTLQADFGGQLFREQIVVGEAAPVILYVDAPEEYSENWIADISVSADGTLTATASNGDDEAQIISCDVTEGENHIEWNGLIDGEPPVPGMWELTLCLLDESGCGSDRYGIDLYVSEPSVPLPAHDAEYFPPNYDSEERCDHDNCFWQLNMGEMDEAAIWQVLTQPITIIPGNERHQTKILAEPDDKCTTYVGEVTQISQGVHVLREQDGWSLIEAYSSSVEGSSVHVFAKQFQGWIRSDKLKTVEVNQTTGIVIDKLQQRLYVFRDGHLYSTLLCSTGYPRKDTQFNETPAGEFITVSWTGGFWAGSLFCDMGIRINDGILLHEVPCLISDDGTRDYTRCERYLGEKASHGCIRIQRAKAPEGVNAKWLWDNLSRKPATKVIIWDELDRTLLYPDDDYQLYYNPKGGKYYHSSPVCAQVKKEYQHLLQPFPYSELEDKPFSSLLPCEGCAPQLRREAIDTLNSKNTRTKY